MSDIIISIFQSLLPNESREKKYLLRVETKIMSKMFSSVYFETRYTSYRLLKKIPSCF